MEEVAARGARVIAVVDDEDSPAGRLAAHRFTVPAVDWLLSPLLSVVPMQLLAYELAVARGPERRPAAQPRQDGHRRIGNETEAFGGRCSRPS